MSGRRILPLSIPTPRRRKKSAVGQPCLSGCHPQPLAVVFGHAHGRSPAWQYSVPTIAPRVPATFSRRRGLRRLPGEGSLERRFVCPHCQAAGEPIRFANRPGVLRCRKCRRDTGLTVGTVMARSHTPLSVWFSVCLSGVQPNTRRVGRAASATTWPVALRDGVPNPPQAPRGDGAPGSGPDRRQARRARRSR